MKIFSGFNDFLNHSVDYLDNRIITGKFLIDIFHQFRRFVRAIITVIKKLYSLLRRLGVFIVIISIFASLWNNLLKIPLFKKCAGIIFDALSLAVSFYSDIFIVFAITFTSTFLLLDWFQSAIFLFFIALIPVILLNNFFISLVYSRITESETIGKISFWEDFKNLIPRFIEINTPLVIVCSLIIESCVAYFFIVFCVTEIFTFLRVPWSGSIAYWFIFTILSSLTIIGLITLIIIMQQSYFYILLNRLPLKKAISQSKMHILEFLPYYLFFNGIFYISSFVLIWRSFLSSLYIGFTFGLYCTLTLGSFLMYLLQRQFGNSEPESISRVNPAMKNRLVLIIIIAGIINYLLVASLIIQKQQPLRSYFQTQQDNYLAQQEMKQYVNYIYGYSIEYPGYWTVYQWSSKSVTIYNNYTKTLSGGTWLNITITPYNQTYFDQLYNDTPGITNYDPQQATLPLR